MKIGFIGLGIMGKPMARNLLAAGHSLLVLNRSRGPVDELVDGGASAGASPRDVAERSDVVITMLPDSPDVEAVMFGGDGVIAGMRSGSTHVDMSTIAPATARRISAAVEAQGGAALDAPVSGGEKGAIEATLSIMVGGARETFEAMLPIFQQLGKNITYVGASGAGQVTKACNQLVVAVTIEAVAEALALAQASGVDPAVVRQALQGGFASSRILDVHGERMIAQTYAPGFKLKLHRKDLGIVRDAARDAALELPAADLVRRRMDELVAHGSGELDHSALRTLIETRTVGAR